VIPSAGAAVGKAIAKLLGQEDRETSCRFRGVAGSGLPVTVHVVGEKNAGSELIRATGSDGHLRTLGERAKLSGYRFDEKGLWRGEDRIEFSSEHDLYEAIDCLWIPPELREGTDELERALSGDLPELVATEDLLGALHNHTTDSDGSAPLESMAEAAKDRGWEFIGIADHSPAATYANGLSAERLRDQWRRIDNYNASNTEVRVIKGIEADILTDGTLDIPDGCEKDLEYLVASVHSAFRLAEGVQTERIVRAVSHPACRVLGHPTGRLLLARPGYAVNLELVFEACAEHDVAVEINASPYRLDLDWRWARRALEFGLKLAVNPDAHSAAGLDDLQWGVAVARKAGATAADLVNCCDIERFLNST
ncbi:MAG: PHP domain-containing protein, partial [Acidobacteriota bacterium]